jgi:hypothetical protein
MDHTRSVGIEGRRGAVNADRPSPFQSLLALQFQAFLSRSKCDLTPISLPISTVRHVFFPVLLVFALLTRLGPQKTRCGSSRPNRLERALFLFVLLRLDRSLALCQHQTKINQGQHDQVSKSAQHDASDGSGPVAQSNVAATNLAPAFTSFRSIIVAVFLWSTIKVCSGK